jgi:ferritin-like metal-binding protein YciE
MSGARRLLRPDMLLLAAIQKVEHYEIATYGTLCAWAGLLGFKNAKEQLGANLAEEENADKTLTKVAKSVNKAAQTVGQ